MGSRSKQRHETKGAFGNQMRRRARIAEQAHEANRIARERALKKTYADFYATEQGQEFLSRGFTKAYQEPPKRVSTSNESDEDFHDPSELDEASALDHPVDRLEVIAPSGLKISVSSLDPEEIDLICETFRHAFRWVLDGAQHCLNGDAPLVSIGKRCNASIASMHPDQAVGLKVDTSLKKEFNRRFKEVALLKTGAWFGRVLEWLRRGDTLSAVGERVYLLAYKLWPDAIDAATLHQLGLMNSKTRQAKDKQANCLRDTLHGLKALTMRADITRARCRASQLQSYEN